MINHNLQPAESCMSIQDSKIILISNDYIYIYIYIYQNLVLGMTA